MVEDKKADFLEVLKGVGEGDVIENEVQVLKMIKIYYIHAPISPNEHNYYVLRIHTNLQKRILLLLLLQPL